MREWFVCVFLCFIIIIFWGGGEGEAWGLEDHHSIIATSSPRSSQSQAGSLGHGTHWSGPSLVRGRSTRHSTVSCCHVSMLLAGWGGCMHACVRYMRHEPKRAEKRKGRSDDITKPHEHVPPRFPTQPNPALHDNTAQSPPRPRTCVSMSSFDPMSAGSRAPSTKQLSGKFPLK
jgi:hypothetical protein